VYVTVTLDPTHAEAELVKLEVGIGYTPTVTVVVLLHPPAVEPVIVYVVVVVGEAVTFGPVVVERPVAGLHV